MYDAAARFLFPGDAAVPNGPAGPFAGHRACDRQSLAPFLLELLRSIGLPSDACRAPDRYARAAMPEGWRTTLNTTRSKMLKEGFAFMFISAFMALFPVANPVGAGFIVNGFLSGLDSANRKTIIRRILDRKSVV